MSMSFFEGRFEHPISSILVTLVAIEHSVLLIVEMFFWSTPAVITAFHPKPDVAECPAVYAANFGVYNGFLAAGLFWAVLSGTNGRPLKIFFLACVIVAGIYGWTIKTDIPLVQAVPAGLALAATLLKK